MSIDGYITEFNVFLGGIPLFKPSDTALSNHFVFDTVSDGGDVVFFLLYGIKKYLNNWLDFFIKLVRLFTIKRRVLNWRAGFIQGRVPFVKVAPCSMKLRKTFNLGGCYYGQWNCKVV